MKNCDISFFAAIASVGLAMVPVSNLLASQGREADQPDIVLFLCDDLGWRDVSCYGSPNVKTPNIDRLAAEGMRFTSAFTASPVCGPTRAQVYSGMYPVNSHAYFNHPSHYVKEGVKTLPVCLQELGYRVGIVGKIDAGPTDAYPFELLAYERGRLVGDSTHEFIARGSRQPFCLVIGSGNPHTPWNNGLPRMSQEDVVVPDHLVDTPETRQALTHYHADVAALDNEVGDCLKLLAETGREDALVLWTSEQGAEVPFGKGTLFDNGMKLAVIARWPGRIKPASVCDEIIQHIDFLPTLVDAAGGTPQPNWDGKSFLPMLEGSTVQNHEFAYGCYGDQRAVRTKRFKYIRNLTPDVQKKHGPSPFNSGAMASDPANQFYSAWSHPKSWLPLADKDPSVARKIQWFTRRAAEELYNIEMDPCELNNVAGSPDYTETLARLRTMCDAIMSDQGDKGKQTVAELKRWQSGQHKAGKGYYQRSSAPIVYPKKRIVTN